ncbi:MAG: YraN family protein [Flavobacteriales bacterium]|nr:YraN family protein [Flavobacteriales bacterium]
MQNTTDQGNIGEEIASTFLEKNGFKIKARQWHFGHLELDLVAEKDDEIVFVEVKLRRTDSYGEPWEAVSQKKRKRIMQAAEAYIIQKDIELKVRFDIISIILLTGKKPEITHIEEAFYPMP